jgi:pimeloyl-ACP methyl ester carboxylesterase
VSRGLERRLLEFEWGRCVVRRRPPAPGASGATALFLHALGGSWRWWRFLLPHLPRDRELLLPDLPGFGASGGLPAPIPEEADRVARALDALGVPAVHVVGLSMGGAVAAELAARHADRVRSLALVDAAGWPVPYFPRYLGRIARPWSWCRPRFLPTLVTDVLRTGPRRLALGARHVVRYDIRPAAAAARVPALVLWGQRDRLLPPEVGRALAASLHARFELVPRAGHIVPGDRPDECARRLAAFWDDVERGGATARST